MKSIKDKLIDNYLFGSIQFNKLLNIYLMPLPYWILNYKKYDPDYDPAKYEFIFRNNILNVSENNIDAFFKAIEIDRVNINDVDFKNDKIPNEYKKFNFFIDFDNKFFINGFDFVELEDYLPDENWKGISDNPLKYLPKEIIRIFEN